MPEHEGKDVIQENGGLEKTVEELEVEKEKAKKDREKRFYDDPDSFVEINKLIVGAIDSSEGILTYIGKGVKRAQLELVQSRINFLITNEFLLAEVIAMKKAQENKRIITDLQNKKGFRGFIGRGRK